MISYPLTVYYDASCPLCATEMHALKARDVRRRLILVDCSDDAFDANARGITRDSMMRIIHARDGNGQWIRGVEVFAAAYEAVYLRSMSRLWRNPVLRPFWDRVYPWIADHRQWLSRLGAQHVVGALIGLVASRDSASRPPSSEPGGCKDGYCRQRSSRCS
jgi:predicted DCC family thiol-disulfide oxidoreductase YuxK